MSAPLCLLDPVAMPTMVSRLPKFSSRPKSTTASNDVQAVPAVSAANIAGTFTGTAASSSTRLTNGFYHHPGPAADNSSVTGPGSSVKQNGFIRAPMSVSLKWIKENGTIGEGGANAQSEQRSRKPGSGGQNQNQYYSQRQQGSQVVSQCNARKTTATYAGKGRGSNRPVTSSSSPSPDSSTRTLPVPKKLIRPASKGTSNARPTLNGFSGSRPRSSSLRQPISVPRTAGARPGSNPASRATSPSQKKVPAIRSHSSDGLGSTSTARLTEQDRIRSHSLSQVRQHDPRSTQAPVTGGKKASVTRQTPGVGVTASRRSAVCGPAALPTSALKKPLLPSLDPITKPSGISYRLSRPSLLKQTRPLRATPTTPVVTSVQINSAAENSQESPAESPETDGLFLTEPASIVGETLDDMSLSSTSSLDRNDTSEEYMDDYDNLGNGGVCGILLVKNDEDDSGLDQSCARFDEDRASVNGVGDDPDLCFLDDCVNWTGMKLGADGEQRHASLLSQQRRPSRHEYHDQGGSSLDLSPSDSCGSAGTYMWDEEGLEPLGGIVNTASINSNSSHHIESFDSDVNSIDILKDLESCDLEDDDLMLDTDFMEDVSLHSDGDGLSHMAEWRRRQLCWGTDVHNDESDFICYKLTEEHENKTDTSRGGDIILDLAPSRTVLPSVSVHPAVPGMDVEELAEDCAAVRSQLELLQMLLLQEEEVDDDTLTTDTLGPEANDSVSHSSDAQVQALQQEVLQLREQLRSRDRTISQLTQQLTIKGRCSCKETPGKTDGHTQTQSATERAREQEPQIFHSTCQDHHEPLRTPCSKAPIHQARPPHQAQPPNQVLSPDQATPTKKIQPPGPVTSLPKAQSLVRTPDVPESTTENDGKVVFKERGGACSRSLRLPQPSKLRLPSPQRSTAAALSPNTSVGRKPPTPHDPESNRTCGLKPKPRTVACGSSSRLPKPQKSLSEM